MGALMTDATTPLFMGTKIVYKILSAQGVWFRMGHTAFE